MFGWLKRLLGVPEDDPATESGMRGADGGARLERKLARDTYAGCDPYNSAGDQKLWATESQAAAAEKPTLRGTQPEISQQNVPIAAPAPNPAPVRAAAPAAGTPRPVPKTPARTAKRRASRHK